MTIQDAIKSGLPFKRKTFKDWLIVKALYDGEELEFRTLDRNTEVNVLPAAVLADDWEILTK